MKEPDVGEWAGHIVFRCPDCAYDSMDADRVVEHIAQAHYVPPKAEPVVIDPIAAELPKIEAKPRRVKNETDAPSVAPVVAKEDENATADADQDN